MPATAEAREVEALLRGSGMLGEADPTFPYGLMRKFFINGAAHLHIMIPDPKP
jgi:hypothetical protein